jgi:polysaccharide deacetylase family protein (PEP-CTERM system associated)
MNTKSPKSTEIKNFITFDIEEWYAANFDSVDLSQFSDDTNHLEKNVDRLLEICDENSVKSTCFILGEIAAKKPHIIRKIHDQGHEIASHSLAHKLVYTMTPGEFRKDLLQSCDRLEQITSEKVVGYRAPSWSVNEEVLPWFYEILEEQGILYSSSVFPGKTFLYGINGFPQRIHQPVVGGRQQKIWEIPQSLFSFAGKNVGFSGGFYMRFFPGFFVRNQLRKANRQGKSVFVYLHPREIDPKAPRLDLPFIEKTIHYWGIAGCEKKFIRTVSDFQPTFTRMKDHILQIERNQNNNS